ncbi:MAG: aminopeptidase P family protein, partial [Fimbriimonadales bacterium]
MDLIREKIAQAKQLVSASDLDAWCIFVRETSEGADPVLPFFVKGALTWQSAILFFKSGKAGVVLGNFDADPLVASGNWDEVVPYVQGIRQPLLDALKKELPKGGRIGVNTSTSDVKADGLSYGMYTLLEEYLSGTPYTLASAEKVCGALRSRKTPGEIARMKGAISETGAIFAQVPAWCSVMPTELDLYRRIQ